MTEMRYLDFDLRIERAEEGYTARILDCPTGEASTHFTMPFSKLELENFVLRMGRARPGVRRLESPEMEAAKVFGGRLFEAVFQGNVRGCFNSSLDLVRRQGSGLRLRLRLDAPEMADLPWEYLYNPSLNRFLSLSVETPVVRYLPLPERIQPLPVTPPLRVLVMIASPSDYPPLDAEREWEKLQESVRELEVRGRVVLERQEKATLSELQRRLRRGGYHIFHFIGHGTFEEQAQDGVLLLEDEEGRGRPISGQYVGTLLHDERSLRLAILNACEGARTSAADPFAGTAQSLVQQGIPAVIAMQFEITDEAAITLSHEFYGAVADGYPVDAALAEARKAVFAQSNDVEWGKPVLYLRTPDGRIFDVAPVSEAEQQQAQVSALYQQAETAMAGEDWPLAIERLQAVLALDPAHAGAAALLEQARRKEGIERLYAEGLEHYQANRWREALVCFRQVQAVEGDYKDVASLRAAIDADMVREKAIPPKEALPTEPAATPPPAAAPAWSGNRLWIVIAAVLAGLLLICGGVFVGREILRDGTPTPTATVTPSLSPTKEPGDTPPPEPSAMEGDEGPELVPSDTPTSTQSSIPEQPAEETEPPPGTVQGSVLWNEQPVEGASVDVYDQYSANSTHYGSATTDASGHFSISGIPEGEQYLYVHGDQPEFWVAAVTPFEMASGTGTLAEDTYLCKGFNPDSPEDGAVIDTSRPTLRWSRYDDAVDYAVRVIRVGESNFVFQRGDRDARIPDTSVQLDVDLSPGEYRWRVDAFNAAGHIIGCSYYPRSFTFSPEQPHNDPAWGGGWTHINPGGERGQSFRPSTSELSAIQVGILTGNPGRGGDTLTLKVLSTDGSILATVSQPVEEGFEDWLQFELPGGALEVTPGQTLRIELADTGKTVFGWKYGGDTYPDGTAFLSGSPKPGWDFFFRVNP